MKRTVAYILILASLAVGFAGGSRMRRPATVRTEYLHDTLVVRDTVTDYRPVPVTTYVHDSLKMTIVMHEVDTQYIYLPHEYRRYRNDSYDLTVSGVEPVLESISVYPETKYVPVVMTEPAKANRWGLGVTAGYGVSRSGLSPFFGVGLTYNLISF